VAATRARPRIYIGGESEPARALAAARADVWFINRQPLEDVRALIADVQSRPRDRAALRYGLSAFVVARPTESEAWAEYDQLAKLAALDAGMIAKQNARKDPAVVMRQTEAKSARLGTNAGRAGGELRTGHGTDAAVSLGGGGAVHSAVPAVRGRDGAVCGGGDVEGGLRDIPLSGWESSKSA
jgi:alkanesulfonate monooxygenase SsuD/methylene tetrahydromethanopterin reductase-like flavin-dependent oxidoreductase (luciferase family)